MSISQVQMSHSGIERRRCALPGHLQAIVLLGGSVRANSLAEAVGRSILDLPVEAGRSLLSVWQSDAADLAKRLGMNRIPMRLMLDRDTLEPAAAQLDEHVVLSVERDPYALRGTGGVLHDLAAAYADDDYLLVASAGQLFHEPLADLALEMADCGGDVVVVAHRDGSPSGLMLVRCGAMEDIPAAGFVDMKEQALPVIARSYSVEVLEKRIRTAMSIRSTRDYIAALRRHHQRLNGRNNEIGPFDEDWQQVFAIVEPGAKVIDARIHDSVVLKDAIVEPGSVIVRSIVCANAVVRKGTMIADEVVGGVNT